jgi:shikimate dehydrogenase
MRRFGLIGYPLGHSFSKKYFTQKFQHENIVDCIYDNYSIDKIELLNSIVSKYPDLEGLNVTIPYKQSVIPFLNEIDEDAAKIRAVNTIKLFREGERTLLKGFNTDIYGFEESIKSVLKIYHKNALILGTGGASKAVAYVFDKLNVQYTYVSRNIKNENTIGYTQVTPSIITKNTIIINTSPLGMFPNVDTCPDIPYDAITEKHLLFDLVYNPEKTLFLKKGEQKKATILNGLPMLCLQAEKSWQIWNS